MGFDCTLHLVDERAIQEQLVPRLLLTAKTSLGAFEKRGGSKASSGARRPTRSS